MNVCEKGNNGAYIKNFVYPLSYWAGNGYIRENYRYPFEF